MIGSSTISNTNSTAELICTPTQYTSVLSITMVTSCCIVKFNTKKPERFQFDTGSPISATSRTWGSCWATRSTSKLSTVAKPRRIESEQLAMRLRGGNFPTCFAYPQDMRGTRDLLRRRCSIVGRRSATIVHVQMVGRVSYCSGHGIIYRT